MFATISELVIDGSQRGVRVNKHLVISRMFVIFMGCVLQFKTLQIVIVLGIVWLSGTHVSIFIIII